ncbi:MAG: NAD(P)/FAD-dependent oxidoreductase [Solirubrobacteraceae bacterium]|jgi:cation diffusion facilitator CzcD-associated flavoprotein CzcO|nr:NAD(P)/FAD-dependent oxidoreductase [Solirubrobacteraceae bacterium]
MATVTALRPNAPTEHLDVLIVGAGISGIGMACYLERDLPGKSYAILEGRDRMGGTWDLFRYPGIRSDSDLHTYGYAFKPWTSAESIASGPAILDYIEETAAENGVDRHIRFGHHVARASWSSADERWTVTATRADTGESVTLTCSWLFVAAGYYRYDQGYLPHFEGAERFGGRIVHPQHWPEDLDYTGKRVVVIGSGATAVTLIPAMTDKAAHVTMLQRSPTYVVSLPEKDPVANLLKRTLPATTAYAITRRKNIWLQKTVYRLSQNRPELVKRFIRRRLERALPEGYDIDTHFTPSYKPWDQRMCSVPDGDLFAAISSGRASVVTDRIETFTETGIRLESGRELEADVIVTATGLDLQLFGGAEVAVDGVPLVPHDHLAYKGFMLSDVPNLAFAFGYTNSSWTLKVDLICEFLCRVLEHMDARGAAVATPVNDDPSMDTRPLLDFGAGYVQRALDRFPVQGTQEPWTVTMAFAADLERLRGGVVDDGILRFSGVREPAATAA